MIRRSSLAALLGLLAALLWAPSAGAVGTPIGQAPGPLLFGHDDTLDGTPGEIVSGRFAGDPATGDPLAARTPNSYEAFEFVVPAGARVGSFTVTLSWQDPYLDFDLYVYRERPDGSLVTANIALSGSGPPDTDEAATYYPRLSSAPVEPGRYVVVVDNWCTNNADPTPGGPCGVSNPDGTPRAVPDEDDFAGRVTFAALQAANALPRVTLAGPDTVRAGSTATFSATATDDGQIRSYAFDLDGDGRFEYDNGASGVVRARFDAPGRQGVGVRVTDDRGGQAYASTLITVAAAPGAAKPATLGLLRTFRLGRPVFGGSRGRALVVTLRLRERARVRLTLVGRGRTVRRLMTGSRAAGRTHRVRVRARGLRPGLYTVRLTARTRGGRTAAARLVARRL